MKILKHSKNLACDLNDMLIKYFERHRVEAMIKIKSVDLKKILYHSLSKLVVLFAR